MIGRARLPAAALLPGAACTGTDEIIIDRKGVDVVRYQQEQAESRA
jgi:hypothetical protein